jgi:L-seryl-tRNA(Ser) seleniumtransferase
MVSYADLGVRPVINAWGTVTVMGGSTLPSEVLTAMVEAGRHYVPIHELQAAAGQYIAKRLGVEAAFIPCGAAAGMALAAAACMAGTDPAYRAQLPDTEGLDKTEIVVFRSMRSNYDQAFRVAGARLVEIGMPKKTEAWELEHALASPRVAAVGYIVEHAAPEMLPLETIIEISHARDVPVIVDAAAEIPPVENLSRYIHLGADLAIFSGGKDIRGPQATGLMVGRKDLIEASAFHSCPNHSIGRGMKVGKEEIMGFVAALDLYLEQDFDAEMAGWEAQVAYVVETLLAIEGVTAQRVYPGEPGIQPIWIPRVYVDWTPAITQRSPLELKEDLLQGEPRVVVGTSATGLVVNPQMLEPGQERIVADCLKRVLENGA